MAEHTVTLTHTKLINIAGTCFNMKLKSMSPSPTTQEPVPTCPPPGTLQHQCMPLNTAIECFGTLVTHHFSSEGKNNGIG